MRMRDSSTPVHTPAHITVHTPVHAEDPASHADVSVEHADTAVEHAGNAARHIEHVMAVVELVAVKTPRKGNGIAWKSTIKGLVGGECEEKQRMHIGVVLLTATL